MTDGMEIMVLSILGPAVHCSWMVPTWQEAFLTSVSKHRVARTCHLCSYFLVLQLLNLDLRSIFFSQIY